MNEKLRILLLTYEGNIAGSTMSISYLARGLSERGHQVVLGCKKNSLYAELLQHTKVTIVHLPFSSKWDLKSIRKIRDIVVGHHINVINAQASYDRYLSIFAKWRYHLPVKLVHTRRQMPLSVGGLQSWFYKKGTDQVVAVSQGVKNALVKKGLAESHVTVIYNGTPPSKYKNIDLKLANKLREQYKIQASDFVVGSVSRLKKQIQLFDSLQYIEQPITVFFIGITAEDLGVEQNHPILKHHKIHFCGTVPPSEVLSYYKLFNLYVLPSTTEGLSQAILEAMYLELPVIATNAGGNPDLIHDRQNGLLFEDGDLKKLAGLISEIKDDQELALKLSQGSKKTAQVDFSIDRTVENYENFYYGLLEK